MVLSTIRRQGSCMRIYRDYRDTCPFCGRKEEILNSRESVELQVIWVGTIERFNDAKKAEEKDRVKHFGV